jgi:leader peptidase (prepilin peptidase)/N-methyltransferase
VSLADRFKAPDGDADTSSVTAAVAAAVLAPGLALGSFLNVAAMRPPLGRSACPQCGSQIRPWDNVPLLSYLLLRGRCRDCAAPIGLRYPAVEAATALLAAACVLVFGVSLHALAAAVFCGALVAISAADLERRIVPNRIVLPATAVVLALQLVRAPSLEWPLAGFGAAAFLFAAALAHPRGMGIGDVKLALLIGVAAGRTVPVALFAALLLGLVPAVILALRHGMQARKLAIPFAPFLATGGLVALFAGHALVYWYLGLGA